MTAALPNDAETLKRLLVRSQAELLEARLMVEKLKLQILHYKRAKFGASSERLTELAQLELLVEELESEHSAIDADAAAGLSDESASDQSETEPVQRKRPARKPLAAHLPRETVVHQPPNTERCACAGCNGALRFLGQDVAEVLEMVPARFKVIRHVRPKYTCAKCQTIVQAPAPGRPIARGLAGPGLLGHVLVSKYADHIPLYRQSEIYAREGVELERSTLAGMVGGAAALLEPLLGALERHVLSADKLHGDDTPVPVLAPGRGRTKTARLWVYVRDERPMAGTAPPAVWFQYSSDRRGERPQAHLKRFTGILQADGYAGFDALYASGRVSEAACWAHYPECSFIRSSTHEVTARTRRRPGASRHINPANSMGPCIRSGLVRVCRWYGYFVIQNAAIRAHAQCAGHSARVARRSLCWPEQRAAIPAMDRPVPTLLPCPRS